ncbi:MAG: hypothetical protein IPN47_24000 [Gemmatimonadetes bacterium]|nr:hypothetical protein [Gemmatimonadota bacterium]
MRLVMSEGMLITIAGCLVGGGGVERARAPARDAHGASASDDVWGWRSPCRWSPWHRRRRCGFRRGALRVDPATAVGAEV